MFLQENKFDQPKSCSPFLVAIINVKPGESNKQAWRQYLIKPSEEVNIKIKIINRVPHLQES
jgi:hypothetical protein